MLLTKPAVHLIGQTRMAEIFDWARSQGLESQAHDTATPLGHIANAKRMENLVEFAGRHCYRSWSKGRKTDEYIRNIIAEGHTSVMEHATVNLAIAGVSRTLTHELVRHRVGIAISQESQRYVNAKDVNFIVPPLYLWMFDGDMNHPKLLKWADSVEKTKQDYIDLMNDDTIPATYGSTIEHKRRAEAARSVLSNAAETRLTWTLNMTSLRHVFAKRGAQGADLEIRRMTVAIYDLLKRDFGIFFEDFVKVEGDFGVPCIVQLDMKAK